CIQVGDRGGSEEPTQAYYKYVEERDAATTKVYTLRQIGISRTSRSQVADGTHSRLRRWPGNGRTYKDNVRDYTCIARKITVVLFMSQGLSAAGFIAAFTVNALVAVELSGRVAMAGMPGAVVVLGQACGALACGYCMEWLGRRGGIALGQIIGVIGAVTAASSVAGRSLTLFLMGLFLVGMARAAVDLGRFAAAEVHMPAQKGRAISKVVLGSTAGAVFGPLLVGPTGKLALWAGFPELAGPYSISFVGLILAAALIFSGLRPDPRDVGRELARIHPGPNLRQETRPLSEIVRQPGVIVAMISVIFAQVVMMVPMSITSVHMKAYHHPLGSLSLVISAHTLGMYAFSVASGWMTDRWGRGNVIILGSAVMILSCLMAAPSIGLVPLLVALFLLGLGWNFAYVAGSTLLADQLLPGERAKTQGLNDLLLNLASGGGQIVSGVVYAIGGYGVMALAAALAAVVPLASVLWWQAARRQVAPARQP
ncbi:MAG: MFS transporter, partial [Syntrophales bacterium LBB04]|nr:MFS transporter [Syntrophales bacterium LBB04]